MKKVLIFCLILLCTLAVFAVDVNAQIKLYLSYGSDGFGFSSNKAWEPVIVGIVGADNAGASFKWCPMDYKNSSYSFDVWFVPGEETNKFLLNVGANFSASFVNGISFYNLMTYGMVGYNTTGYSQINANPIDTSGVNAQLGFGYQPESFRKFFNADVFIAGYVNYLNIEIGTFHFDGLTKLNVENKKPSLDHSLSEVSFNRFVEAGACVENSNTDRIVAITKQFNADESHYFDHESLDEEQDWKVGAFKSGFIAGLRYKYFTDADKSIYNGLYGYGLGSYALENSVSFEVETEVGRYDAELEIESRGSKDLYTEKVYSLYEFDWVNGKIEAALTDFYAYIKYSGEKYIPYIKVNYENLKTNTPEANGIYFNPGFLTTVVSDKNLDIDFSTTVGFNSLKNFKWSAQSSFSIGW